MGLNLRAHEYTADPKTGILHVSKVNHCINLGQQGQPNVYLQEGQAYYANGQIVSPLPEWVVAQLKILDKAALKRVGWTVPGEETPASTVVAPDPIAELMPEIEDPLKMKYFALKAWAKKEHEIDGASREEILAQLVARGVIKE